LPLPFDNRISSANFLFSLRTEVLFEAFVAASRERPGMTRAPPL